MNLRPYAPRDCPALCALLTQTVYAVNAADYTQEQLDAWTACVSAASLGRALSAHYSLVAVERGEIVGFGDIDATGYLDHLYVHRAHQRHGAVRCARAPRARCGADHPRLHHRQALL